MAKAKAAEDPKDVAVASLAEGMTPDFITGQPVKETPKESVRQELARALLFEYRISPQDMQPDFSVPVDGKRKRVDIAIFEAGKEHTVEHLRRAIICRPQPNVGAKSVIKLRDHDQAKDDLNELKDIMGAAEGCIWGLWTNGIERFFLKKEPKRFEVRFDPCGDWPMGDETLGTPDVLADAYLRKATEESLRRAFQRCHNFIHGNEGMPKDAAFWQFLYLIFAKMYDERRNNGDRQFWAGPREQFDAAGQMKIRGRILPLFEAVKKEYKHIFRGNEEITLSDRALAYMVSELARYDLTRTEVDVKGAAYQEIVGTNLRGDRGQYFTPRRAVNLTVEILDPKPNERVLDLACGTGGFLVSTIRRWILRHCWVLACVEVPVEAFIVEANVGILTSLLFLKKKTEDEINAEDLGKKTDYPVFMAVAEKAGVVHLGLRRYFRGSIEHLRGCVDERTVSGTTLRRKYLVIYDQVPGGTGYLKQLSQKPEIFLEVLRLALAHLKNCQCATRADHDTDGCHRCILQSRHARDHAGLSRTTAIRLLETILANADQLERVDRVSDIDIHPLIKSELEKSFLESLRAVPGAQLQAKIVRNKPGYLWRNADAAWEVAPQMDVAVGQGMDVPSIPDFVLYPVRADQSRPLAVFLDGFKFHADEASGHNRVARDVQQRQALVHSGQYWVWNFSWEDIQFRNDPAKIPSTLTGETHAQRRSDMAHQLLTGDELSLAQSVGSYTSWSLFLEFLARPNPAFWEKISYLYALTLPGQLQPVSLEKATSALSKLCQGSHELSPFTVVQPADGLGGACTSDEVSAFTLMTNSSVKDREVSGVFFLLSFDDDRNIREPDFPRHWRGFLRLTAYF